MWTIIALAGFFVGFYFAILRPILMARPVARQMIDRADGWLAWFWALCYQSATVVITYVGALVGVIVDGLDVIANMVGDPGFQDQISKVLGGNPKLLGGILMAFSAIVFMARMRSIIKG